MFGRLPLTPSCVLIAAAAIAAASCEGSPITSARVERAIAPTFANLVHLQLARIGLPAVAPADITVRASCRKLLTETGADGAGEWVCVLDWSGPNQRTLRDVYDLSVGTDGCYVTTIEGDEAGMGGPVIAGPDGRSVRNLLYAFEGCFDKS